MEKLVIRQIQDSDDKQLAELIRDSLKENNLDIPGTAYFDSELDCLSNYYLNASDRVYYVLSDNQGKVYGGIGLSKYGTMEGCGELQKLYLSSEIRGQGYGYKLITFLMEKAIEMGYKLLYLETHRNLTAAIHIYEKMGFQKIERLPGSIHSTMDRFYILPLVACDDDKEMN